VLLLAHVPPVGVALKANADPVHITDRLLLMAGRAVTVITLADEQLPNE
jgi:hypothetical protein